MDSRMMVSWRGCHYNIMGKSWGELPQLFKMTSSTISMKICHNYWDSRNQRIIEVTAIDRPQNACNTVVCMNLRKQIDLSIL